MRGVAADLGGTLLRACDASAVVCSSPARAAGIEVMTFMALVAPRVEACCVWLDPRRGTWCVVTRNGCQGVSVSRK